MFGGVTLTKNADIDKYKYSGYGFWFDRRSAFSFPGGGFGQNVLILGVDMRSSAPIDYKKKDILVLLYQERNSVWACIITEQKLLVCQW